MKKSFSIFLLFISFSFYAQLRPTIYTHNLLGFDVHLSSKLMVEARLRTNRFSSLSIESLPFETEFLMFYSVLDKESYNLNFGLGANIIYEYVDPLTSFVMPANIEITTFQETSLSFVSFVFEPAIVFWLEETIDVRALIGVKLTL